MHLLKQSSKMSLFLLLAIFSIKNIMMMMKLILILLQIQILGKYFQQRCGDHFPKLEINLVLILLSPLIYYFLPFESFLQ
jgi:hypothetical protein